MKAIAFRDLWEIRSGSIQSWRGTDSPPNSDGPRGVAPDRHTECSLAVWRTHTVLRMRDSEITSMFGIVVRPPGGIGHEASATTASGAAEAVCAVVDFAVGSATDAR